MPQGSVREHLLTALLQSSEDAVVSVSLSGTIETWSCGAERVYGYAAQEIIGQHLRTLVPLHELPALDGVLSEPRSTDWGVFETCERIHRSGTRIFVRIKRVLVRDEQGRVSGILESGRQLNSQGADLAAEEPLRHVLEQMPGIHWTTDQNLKIRSMWGKGLSVLKIRPGAFLGRSVCEFLSCADRYTTPIAEHYEVLRGLPAHFEFAWRSRVWEISIEPLGIASGEINGCIALGMDITDRKRSEELTHHQARHDALTGLANYREFMDRLEQEVRRADRSHRSFTLLLLDLDGLKRINDLHGHLAGNRALQRLAAVMNEHCRSTDLAVRYGGDEFAVILIDSDKRMAEQVAHRIENGLRSDQGKPPITVSIGIAVYPADGRSAGELIETADQQLYKYKRAENKHAVAASGRILNTKRAGR
jgi:diguanylate cyclase (GGDEF)-like protein/PAS domain S-box-containing protein